MPLSDRENYLRTAAMTGGEWVPCRIYLSGAMWDAYGKDLGEVVARHPIIFPGFKPDERDYENWDFGLRQTAGRTFTDPWGCVWETEINGVVGQVVESPLAAWESLETYQPPDPRTHGHFDAIDWGDERQRVADGEAGGRLTTGGIDHGFLLMRLWYVRGFENLMIDFATKEPRLGRLIERVAAHSRYRVHQYLQMGVDVMSFGEDLGTQTASIISPADFRAWIAPAYRDLMRPCREAGMHVYLHSDGYVMELMDILLDCGVSIINPQDLCNGIDALAREVKGRACIDLDIDRQRIVPFGTRQDIHDLIEEEVRKLGSPQGGLMMKAGVYPPTTPDNVDALCCAMEEFRTYWFDGRNADFHSLS